MASSSLRKNSNSNYVADTIPDDLVFELLISLPGRQIARCKCVCKSWRSVIKSVQFKDAYGIRQRGLILHWFQPVFNPASGLNMSYSPMRLNIFHSPLRELKGPEEQQDFSWLSELGTYGKDLRMTQIVNGLLCIDHGTSGLFIYNVCTREKMRIPVPRLLKDMNGEETYHLGYDPASGMYKLLSWMWYQYKVQAHIQTLRPRGGRWRKLDCNAYRLIVVKGMRTSTSDGFLCWKDSLNITLFDLNKEKFHEFELPYGYSFSPFATPHEVGFARAQYVENQQRVALSLWSHFDRRGYIECCVMEDDEGKKWSKHVLGLPKRKTAFSLANGNLCTSTGDMVLVNVEPGNEEVYCYSRDCASEEVVTRFQVGKLPGRTYNFNAEFYQTCGNYLARLSCLSDGNYLYLPLDDILGGL